MEKKTKNKPNHKTFCGDDQKVSRKYFFFINYHFIKMETF